MVYELLLTQGMEFWGVSAVWTPGTVCDLSKPSLSGSLFPNLKGGLDTISCPKLPTCSYASSTVPCRDIWMPALTLN